MKARSIVSSIVLASVAFGAGWLCKQVTDGSAPVPSAEPIHPLSSGSASASPTRITNLTASSREAIHPQDTPAPVIETQRVFTEPTMEDALAALDRAIQASPIYEDSDALFEEKYRGVSLESATQAAELLNERVQREKERIIEERMRLGLYDERTKDSGEAPPKMTGKGKGLTTFGIREAVMPDGSVRVRTTEVPAQEYAEFNSAQMEWWFLHRKIRGKGLLVKPASLQQAQPSGG